MNKRHLSIFISLSLVCLLALPVHSQIFSLWGDVEMTTCEFFPLGPYIPFDVFLMLDPGPDGAFGAEYMLVLPVNLIVQVTTPSPVISVGEGNVTGPDGISLGFHTCQTELFIVYHFLLLPMTVEPGYIKILPHAETERLVVVTCEEPLRPEKDCMVFNWFRFNTPSSAVEETSWGAIKALSRQ